MIQSGLTNGRCNSSKAPFKSSNDVSKVNASNVIANQADNSDGIAWDLQQVIFTASKDHKIFSRDDKWRSRQLQQTWSTIDIPVTSKEDIVTLACLNYPPDHRRPYFGALFQYLCAANGLAKKARIDDTGETEMNE
ncbi:hypothetical protein K4K48_009911 [Colletotrichum sp. SAR 10_66]|nr:hypothetical protein K4K51_012103 [Colletotrichum sp. SAR 10_75]KAJ5004428.1 hypothetical protein K4K48_009911 [Colletotrichum sp. SAR 10_66]